LRAKTTIPALALATLIALPAGADPGDDDRASTPAPAVPAKTKKHKQKHHAIFSGQQVPEAKLRDEPVARPSGHLHLYAVNFREEVAVDLYKGDGQLDPAAIDQLNHIWRCKRTGTEKPVNPRLFEILSLVSDHFGGRTIELVSGFRNQPHTTSFHFHASASDIHITGVSEKALRDYLASIDTGGMGLGIYPRGGFIHVDVRPEPSYRWVDYSPPGTGEGYTRHHTKKRAPNS
jgi:uncharacterized protein YcbK (DUF882 family)